MQSTLMMMRVMRAGAAFCLFCLTCSLLHAGCGDKMEAHLNKFMEADSAERVEFGDPAEAHALAEQDALADRIHATSFAEVAQRLGAHRFRSRIYFHFQRPEHHTSLKEQTLIVMATNGDFRVKVENDGGQGYELVYSAGKLFVRNRYGRFHERSLLEQLHISQREQAYGAWGSIYRLYRGRLAFTKKGPARHYGRDALEHTISLSTRPPRWPGTREQPNPPEGVTKYVYAVEPTPSERDRWRDKAVPTRATGRLLVDTDTGVVLKVDFSGQLRWKDGRGVETTLSVTADVEADGFGNPAAIEPPALDSVKPLPERIEVATHPLDFFFGKGFTAKLGPPAGVARKSDIEGQADGTDSGGSASKP